MPKRKAENAAERVIRRIAERIDSPENRELPPGRKKTYTGLAAHLEVNKSSISEIIDSAPTRGLLARLDKVAEYLGVPPSLLVHANDTAFMELKPDEYRWVQHWRSWSTDVQEQIMATLDYFAGLLPEEKEERRWWTRIRRLRPQERERMDRDLDDAIRARRLEAKTRRAADAPNRAAETAEGPPARRRRRQQ